MEKVSIRACRWALERTQNKMVVNVPLQLCLPPEPIKALVQCPELRPTVLQAVAPGVPLRLTPKWLDRRRHLPPRSYHWVEAVAILIVAQVSGSVAPNRLELYSHLHFWHEVPLACEWSHCGTLLIKLIRTPFPQYYFLLLDFLPCPPQPSRAHPVSFLAQGVVAGTHRGPDLTGFNLRNILWWGALVDFRGYPRP